MALNQRPRGGGPVYAAGGLDPGYGNVAPGGSPASGPAGVGGTGGYGFTNIQQYMSANPMQGNAYATPPTGTGQGLGDYTSSAHGYAASGQYTPGMANTDNALNQVYQKGGQPTPAQAPGYTRQGIQPMNFYDPTSGHGFIDDVISRAQEAQGKVRRPPKQPTAQPAGYKNINHYMSQGY